MADRTRAAGPESHASNPVAAGMSGVSTSAGDAACGGAGAALCLRQRRACLLWPLAVWTGPHAWSQPGISYQKRAGRYEGVKARPVSGYAIELISFLVGNPAQDAVLPERLRLKFLLRAADVGEVHIVVRDLDAARNYWLDKVVGDRPWAPGYGNEFSWPTADVLRQLPGLGLRHLGALVRLGSEHPRSAERVAPALLYARQAPESATEYRAVVKTNGSARLRCEVYREGRSEPLWKSVYPRQMGGLPLTIRWDASGAGEGPYTLLVEGYFLDSNRPFSQSIRFYHQPRLA